MTAIRNLSGCILLALVGAPAMAATAATSYVVLLNDAAPASEKFAEQVSAAGGSVQTVLNEIGVAIASSDQPNFKSKLSRMKGISGVAYSLPVVRDDAILTALGPDAAPDHIGSDEPFYPFQWGLDAVNAPEAWEAGATGAGVRVAVLDSGIDHDNLDLAANINQTLSRSFLPCYYGLNCDADGNEDWRVREVGEYSPGAFFNHGTHVAGTIAAANNGYGGIGVAPEAEIVAVKVCTEFGTSCFDEAILPGIVYAASIGADLINMSLGGVGDRNPSEICKIIRDSDLGIPCGEIVASFQVIEQAYRRAFHYANSRNTTVVLSAGNSALDADRTGSLKFYFADFPNVLGISALGPVGSALPAIAGGSATDPTMPVAGPDTLAYYSNYGRSIIDFAAPGGNTAVYDLLANPLGTFCQKAGFVSRCYLFDAVLSNGPGDNFFWAEGTSMAAPHATGVAAIIIGLNGGDMAPQRLRTAMKNSSDDLGMPGHDAVFGDGRINAGAAAQ